MELIDKLIEQLNPEQVKPVLDTEGAVLVIAGAGSGKTRVLTTRIAYLVLKKGVSPRNIMAITFTNKAAGEMKERLAKIIGGANDMWVSTIHSMCVRILRRDIDKLGYDKNFTIYDETDKDKVFKRVLEDLGYEADTLLKPAKSHISNAKNECLSPEEFAKKNVTLKFVNEITEIYKAYERELGKSNALDFDDLLFKTYVLFKDFPEVADYYSNLFEYIHIDEFQDTNKVQFMIAERLAIKHGNIFVVGDDDQSIYGWRGAKIENILSFDQIHPGAKVYKLEQNYRSTKKILTLANCIIANNEARRKKELWTENGEGAKIETFVGADENNEATFAAIQIKNLMARNPEYKYSDFAVFMRVNALSRAYEQEFTKYGIPYRIFGGFRFFERKEIKDILAYLKIINNNLDDESFIRSVSVPKRGIGDKTLRELREFSASKGLSMFDSVDLAEMAGIGSAAKTKLFNFKNMLDSFKSFAKDHTPAELIEHIIETTSFNDQFAEKSEENTSKLYNLSELKNSAEQFSKENPNTGLADYLNSVTLSTDTDGINEGDTVTVATIHASKGLEYKCVFVAGLDDKILPLERSIYDPAELEEERRLMYVAVTRAMERLYLTRANSRYMYGRRDFMTQSRFLKEAMPVINPQAAFAPERRESPYSYGGYSESGFGGRKNTNNDRYAGFGDADIRFGGDDNRGGGYSSTYAKANIGGSKPQKTNAPVGKYKTGTRVKHPKFGEGTVIETKGDGENIIVTVAFKGVGIKTLAAKFAPMEIL